MAYQEPAIEGLSALSFDSIVSGPSLGGVCPTARLPFHLSTGRVAVISRGRG